ncbi:hypothetical protein Hanom_Chr01g00080911 [Helianthus anomalus]
MVLDNDRGIITFIDPICGERYFIKTPQELKGDYQIYCSKYGWLLMFKIQDGSQLAFFNPLTRKILKLPEVPSLDMLATRNIITMNLCSGRCKMIWSHGEHECAEQKN